MPEKDYHGATPARALHSLRRHMGELTTIGDYTVRAIAADGWLVRYEATHVVMPRRALIDLVEPAAPQSTSVALLRRACILEALRHPSVPRVFECGRIDGRPWVAYERSDGITLEDELRRRHLHVGEVLELLEQVGSVLSHAHARGVLHCHITTTAIIRKPALILTGWDHACAYDHAPGSHQDVFALATVALATLADHQATMPDALAKLLARMLAADPATRPTADEVVALARAIPAPNPPAAGVIDADDAELDAAIDSLIEDDSDEVVIEYLNADSDEEPVELDSPRRSSRWTPGWNGGAERGPNAELVPTPNGVAH